MNTPNAIHIFKPGRHTAMSGAVLDFTQADLAACAAAYDAGKHEAPLVVGHPVHDGPAHGWVKGLQVTQVEGCFGLEAMPHQIQAEFAEWVRSGALKKVSASFYSPSSPQNPVPGVYYLRHVGFLGSQPPAVKGLRDPQFASDETGVVEFCEEISVVQPEGEVMSAEDKARLELLEAENLKLKADAAAVVVAGIQSANASFTETLVREGRMVPGVAPVMLAALNALSVQGSVVEFGEGAAKAPLVTALKAALQAAAPVVAFGEVGVGSESASHAGIGFKAPTGMAVDTAGLVLHQRALAYAETNKVDYVSAVSTLQQKGI